MSDWPKLPASLSTTRWNDAGETPLLSAQHRRLLMATGARNNLSLDSKKDSPDFQTAFTRFVFPSHTRKVSPNLHHLHQSDPGGL